MNVVLEKYSDTLPTYGIIFRNFASKNILATCEPWMVLQWSMGLLGKCWDDSIQDHSGYLITAQFGILLNYLATRHANHLTGPNVNAIATWPNGLLQLEGPPRSCLRSASSAVDGSLTERQNTNIAFPPPWQVRGVASILWQEGFVIGMLPFTIEDGV